MEIVRGYKCLARWLTCLGAAAAAELLPGMPLRALPQQAQQRLAHAIVRVGFNRRSSYHILATVLPHLLQRHGCHRPRARPNACCAEPDPRRIVCTAAQFDLATHFYQVYEGAASLRAQLHLDAGPNCHIGKLKPARTFTFQPA